MRRYPAVVIRPPAWPPLPQTTYRVLTAGHLERHLWEGVPSRVPVPQRLSYLIIGTCCIIARKARDAPGPQLELWLRRRRRMQEAAAGAGGGGGTSKKQNLHTG